MSNPTPGFGRTYRIRQEGNCEPGVRDVSTTSSDQQDACRKQSTYASKYDMVAKSAYPKAVSSVKKAGRRKVQVVMSTTISPHVLTTLQPGIGISGESAKNFEDSTTDSRQYRRKKP